MHARQVQFEWDESKALANVPKHGVPSNTTMLSVVYRWSDVDPATTKIRIISALKATQNEIMQYQEGL